MKTSRSRNYIRQNRPKKAQQRGYQSWLYRTTFWKTTRQKELQKRPLCRECEKHGITKQATELDHIIPVPVENDKTIFVMYSKKFNLQGLCEGHHAIKSAKEGYDNRYSNKK